MPERLKPLTSSRYSAVYAGWQVLSQNARCKYWSRTAQIGATIRSSYARAQDWCRMDVKGALVLHYACLMP